MLNGSTPRLGQGVLPSPLCQRLHRQQIVDKVPRPDFTHRASLSLGRRGLCQDAFKGAELRVAK